MLITQNINLDFGRDTMPPSVFVKQHDSDTRKLVITPLNNGEAYTIGNGITARFHMTKPDGTTVIDDATISSGKIEFTLTAQCLAAAGLGVAEIGLYSGTQLLTTQTFYLDIKRGAYSESAVESSDEYNSLINALERSVPKTRKVAGIDLQDDITVSELKTALDISGGGGGTRDLADSVGTMSDASSLPVGQDFFYYTDKNRLYIKDGANSTFGLARTDDVSGKEDASNKVTSLSSSSTDTQYPSAKCVYDLIGDIESALAALL